MKNIDLKTKYDNIWSDDAYEKFFTTDNDFRHNLEISNYIENWKNLKVLDLGCGEGDLASIIASAGAKITAIDYSEKAIQICKNRHNLENLEFKEMDYKDVKERFDVIIMKGVLEHFDDSFSELNYLIKNNLNRNGVVITSSPSFLNLRGHIWMTLQLLFDIPMSLTDLNFLCPFDFEEFCQKNNYTLKYKSIEQDQGCGEKLLTDFDKRLRNALRDKNMPGNVDKLLKWLGGAVKYKHYDDYTGAVVIYKITKKI